MAANDNPKPESNEKRAYRGNQLQHFETISKSIGKIVNNTNNADFRSQVCELMNVKIGRRKKTVQSQVMKLLNTNYQDKAQSGKKPYKSNVSQTFTSGRMERKAGGKSTQ